MSLRNTLAVLILGACALNGQVDVLTAQYSNNRTSSNTQEQILTQANVNVAQFGKLFSRTVDAPFYASPLIATNLNIPGVGTKDVVFVATLGNTLYAFDADDPNAPAPYWSVNVGTPMVRGCCFLVPTIGILSTPVIDRSSNTIYFTAIVQNSASDIGLYLYAADLGTGALKFNSPQRITYTFPGGLTVNQADLPGSVSWLQRAGLLLVNGVLYVGTSAVWQGDTIFTQEGFIQAFQANDLSVLLGSFETTPSGAGGAFWQAGRGIAADSSGNVFAVVDSGTYDPPNSFGDSVIKFSPGTVNVTDWFTSSDWSFLFANDLDQTANGVTLIPGTSLAFTGGKVGIIYLLNQNSLGGLQPGSGNTPLQQFQASQGCGTQQCGQHLPTAFWPSTTNPYLYVWDIYDVLRAWPFNSATQQFVPGSPTIGTLQPSRTGGMTISSNADTGGTGIVWAATAAANPQTTAVPGTLRAYNANNITQELYDSDQNSCRDSMGSFVKMSTPIVANGKVYVNTQSNVLPVYGLLSNLPASSPPTGTIQVTVNSNIPGPTITVDGNAPCTGPDIFYWTPGSVHTIAASSPQTGLPGTAPQAGTPGTQFVWTGWSDTGAISHSVSPAAAATYTATFTTQYLLTTNVSPIASGTIAANVSSTGGYYNAGSQVQLTATPVAGCAFVSWSGAVSGSTNPQTVTMSAAESVTANFQCSVAPPASFVTGYSSKLLRNDFSGWAGMEFTVGSSSLTVSALGRVFVYSDNGTHQVQLVNAGNGAQVPGGSVSISMPAGNAGQFSYAPLASPVTLQPNTSYYLVSQETSGGDLWYDIGPISTTSDASVPNAIYSNDGVSWLPMDDDNSSYVPVSFLYTVGAPAQYLLSTAVSPLAGGSIAANPSSANNLYTAGTPVQLTAMPAAGCTFLNWTGALTGSTNPQSVTMSSAQSVTANFQCSGPQPAAFLTGYALNNPSLRQDFTGWVGMKLTVGANPVSVSALGRICVANNVAAHVVKFVNVSDGSDVPGASASVNMAGCTPNQFSYSGITPVTLAAGASYYLISQETYGGDQWYDEGAVSASNAATVISAVYSYNGAWYPVGSGNMSYVPPNFEYSVVTPQPVTVNVGTSPSGASFTVDGSTYTTAQTLPWTSGSQHTIATTSPQSEGAGSQLVWSGWSDAGAISHGVAPTSAATYTATFATQVLLTTTVSPAGAGSISANLPSANGYYTTGTQVQLTANPAAGCTFVNWTGNVTSNPETVTLSTAQTVTATFQCTGTLPATFVTGYDLTGQALRNDFTGWVGMKLTAGANSLTVSSLGRICVAGNTQTHTVKFVNAGTGSDIAGASASVSMAGCAAGQFVFSAISSPVSLAAGASVYLVSQETQGGDQWYDQGGISATNAASVNSVVYSWNGSWYSMGSANTSYVPPNFQYTTGTATPQYTLTTNVSSPGDGSVTANPSATSYANGTPVQLTAVPAANCTFVDWTGNASGAANPTTVTMSASLSVTAVFQCTGAPPSSTAFLTGYGLSGQSLRNDFTGWAGMKLTTGANPPAISSLGRICVANNSQTHTVKFVNASTATDVPGATAQVSMAGCTPGQFVSSSVSSITLQASTSYYLVSQETQGGDQWYDQSAVSTAAVASVNSAVYSWNGSWYPIGSANTSYVPPNFQYTTGGATEYVLTTNITPAGSGAIMVNPSAAGGSYANGTPVQLTATPAASCTFVNWTGTTNGTANPLTVTMSTTQTVTADFQCSGATPAAFVTSYDLSGQSLRNDFTGWVGMKLTTGTNPLTVSSLGRICVAGNSQTHTVKFVSAGNGSDVPGASVAVNMTGCTPGQFVYSAITPVVLPAGTTYYLVSQETQGGDQWYDQGAISTTTAATSNNSVYFYGGNWISINSANTSYVPPNFLYQ